MDSRFRGNDKSSLGLACSVRRQTCDQRNYKKAPQLQGFSYYLTKP